MRHPVKYPACSLSSVDFRSQIQAIQEGAVVVTAKLPRLTPRDAKRILVVDDEARMIGFIRMNLELEGFQVLEAHDGMKALEIIRTQLPDLVILDVMMPELDGFETLRILREFSNIPVIMLTAKGEEDDRVYGLELGADDYITKPFGPRELSSRVRAVLRRLEAPSTASERAILKIDDRLSVDFNRREVIVEGKHIKLRPTEYRLLYHLIENAGWTVTHEQLLAKVWGYEYRDEAHYVRLYINYLREKIEQDPSHPKYILTERGVGYRFVDFRSGDISQASQNEAGSN
jgi:two-component system KDP operon response regulator KdpE